MGWQVKRPLTPSEKGDGLPDYAIHGLSIETQPRRKKPSLVLYEGNEYMVHIITLATFRDQRAADVFEDMLQRLIHAKADDS